MVARTYSSVSNGINPALGFGFQFVFSIHTGKWNVFPMSYTVIIGPYLGAVISVIVFEYVYLPFFPEKP